jgi:hypothetical protein
LIAYVIAVSMTEENDVYFPKPRITATSYRRAHVIENSDAGWIFKKQRPIVLAQLTGV